MIGTTIIPVILCGGIGRRLHPLSTPDLPKQFLPFFADGKSLFQQALERALAIAPPAITLVTTASLAAITKEQITPYRDQTTIDMLIEPCARNTAAAIALAMQHIKDDCALWVKPSDHLIARPDILYKAVKDAARLKQETALTLFGIPPGYPCDQYGYIKTAGAEHHFQAVHRFIEKPERIIAEKIYNDGRHFWNSGMVFGPVQAFRQAFARHAPVYLQTPLNDFYETLPPLSFDKAVLEKTGNSLVIPCPCDWQDMGSREAFEKKGML